MSTPLSDLQMEQIRTSLYAGRKIEAIKLYRDFTGKGLREAKDFADTLEAELRRISPGEFTAPPRSKGLAVAVILLFLLICVILLLLR